MTTLRPEAAGSHTARVLAELAALRQASGWGFVEISRPPATAAFSRLDTLSAGYAAAATAARRLGFAPVVRPAGGHLAPYHGGALVVDVLARHPDPAAGTHRRFAAFTDALAAGLRSLGLDARAGAVPGEYCPGRFSVNLAGRRKVAGTAQRITRGSFFLSAVVLVRDPEPVRAVLAATYPRLGLDWDPAAVGCLADQLPAVTPEQVATALLTALPRWLPLAPGPLTVPRLPVRMPLDTCWDPP